MYDRLLSSWMPVPAIDSICLRVNNNYMSPGQALQTQIMCYRQMTGKERLAIVLRLHELACGLAREGIWDEPDSSRADHLRP
jgi:hypothetical protein